MPATDITGLLSCRYSEDIELLKAIRAEASLVEEQKRAEVLRKKSQLRMRLLATAVRIDEGMLPRVAESLAEFGGRIDVGKPLEAYVFSEGEVQAFISETGSRFLVGLSSGAVSTLSVAELEFVIGHELGHALFGHTEVSAGFLVDTGRVSPGHSRLLRGWQRATEISADRVGLLCTADLDVAATALVKTLAGLSFDGRRLAPASISSQLDALMEEVLDEGAGDLWEHSHPFPPLRIRALEAFWRDRAADNPDNGDSEIRRYLGLMDGTAAPGSTGAGAHEGQLARFLFWGGLFVGTADGPLDLAVRRRLDALTMPGVDLDQILQSGEDPAALALERFRGAKQARRSKLRAMELSNLMKQLVVFAALDERFSDNERSRLILLAAELGLGERAVELLLAEHQKGKQ